MKDLSEFSPNPKARDGAASWCKECKRKDGNPQREKVMLYLAEYKAEHGCRYCGEKNPKILDFHHTQDKSFTISENYHRPWMELIEEIRKCVVLCKTCHRGHHKIARKLSTI